MVVVAFSSVFSEKRRLTKALAIHQKGTGRMERGTNFTGTFYELLKNIGISLFSILE